MTTSPHENEPPDLRLLLRAVRAALFRVLDNGRTDADDLARLGALVRAIKRLEAHLDREEP